MSKRHAIHSAHSPWKQTRQFSSGSNNLLVLLMDMPFASVAKWKPREEGIVVGATLAIHPIEIIGRGGIGCYERRERSTINTVYSLSDLAVVTDLIPVFDADMFEGKGAGLIFVRRSKGLVEIPD